MVKQSIKLETWVSAEKVSGTRCTGRRACQNPSLLFVGENDAKRKLCKE